MAELRAKRRLPIGHQALIGVGGLLALLAVSMSLAIVLVNNLASDETQVGERDVSYSHHITTAALAAKGVANDQRGFLMSGDSTYLQEADQRVAEARSAFDLAMTSATTPAQRDAVHRARAGFEEWVTAVQAEFQAFQSSQRQSAIAASLGPDRALRKTYEQSLADAQVLGDSSVEAARDSLASTASWSVRALWVCLLVALGIGLALAYWLIRTVALPLFRLVALLMPDAG
jgi:methyl-accepting chemotaxis protein